MLGVAPRFALAIGVVVTLGAACREDDLAREQPTPRPSVRARPVHGRVDRIPPRALPTHPHGRHVALPILMYHRIDRVLTQLGMRATAYVIVDRISNGDPSFLTWNQLRNREQHGIEVGSHTLSHRDLT